jgi:hypothetical protein
LKARDAGGGLRTIQSGKIRDDANVLRLFYTPMTVTVAPAEFAQTQGVFDFPYTLTAHSAAQIFPSGGLPPYTYSWERVAGNANVAATAPAAEVTGFTSVFAEDEIRTATFKGTATDASGATASGLCEVTLTTVDWD